MGLPWRLADVQKQNAQKTNKTNTQKTKKRGKTTTTTTITIAVIKNAPKFDWSGIRTHASEETSALNWRLRPLGHPTTWNAIESDCATTPKSAQLQEKLRGGRFELPTKGFQCDHFTVLCSTAELPPVELEGNMSCSIPEGSPDSKVDTKKSQLARW